MYMSTINSHARKSGWILPIPRWAVKIEWNENGKSCHNVPVEKNIKRYLHKIVDRKPKKYLDKLLNISKDV